MNATLCIASTCMVLGCVPLQSPVPSPETRHAGVISSPSIVVIPTLGSDHQFNLEYTVAHLAAVLDAIDPDAVIVGDYSDWLAAGCVWAATNPEYHLALMYTNERRIPIFGTRPTSSSSWFEATRAAVERLSDAVAPGDSYRTHLDHTVARIARDYSFNPDPQSLEALIRTGFALPGARFSAGEKELFTVAASSTADSILRVVQSHPQRRRWAVILPHMQALPVEVLLRTRADAQIVPLEGFLPLARAGIGRRMDAVNVGWILSGLLDEWYGMWAPQVFPSHRIAELLLILEELAPHDQSTLFLKARWLMQNRDYVTAEPLLLELVADSTNARVRFPINPKWIRPPWSRVGDKAKLNLAFIYDLQGKRDSALALYGQLLARGEGLNAEAQAAGYNFDNIYQVIRSYEDRPYTGMPEEAFRHFPHTVARPQCDPHGVGLAVQP